MTLAEFRAFYPEFSGVDDIVVQRYLDLFICQFGEQYGCMTGELQGLFVAHRLTIWKRTNSGSAGAVVTTTSKSVGDESLSGYVAGGGDGGYGDYSATAYGIQFWNNIKLYGSGGFMAEAYQG